MMKRGFHTRVVRVGDLELGGEMPIRIQSMTNTPTMDTEATVRQVIGLADAGCELVRITAQNLKEAHHLQLIRQELLKRGCKVPLAADIHYLPEAAEVASRHVQKVRINPGNYSEKKRIPIKGFSDREYQEELEKIAGKLYPLIKVCRDYGTAIRIGTNHGSLSERIVFRYGNTPAGMVESALEFARIFSQQGFHDLVLSMKASNILTVLHSNRLLVARMMEEGMDYPIHLGVTEAGEGEDGRIKSAAGIGILLSEGIGDTIRVSLTEDPLEEIPFAASLAAPFNSNGRRKPSREVPPAPNPYEHHQDQRTRIGTVGGGQSPVVIARESFNNPDLPGADFILQEDHLISPLTDEKIPLVHYPSENIPADTILMLSSPVNEDALELRRKMIRVHEEHPGQPIIIDKDLGNLEGDDLTIKASIELGMVLTDGWCDGLMFSGGKDLGQERAARLAFDILQATGRRISKTEYISCPSCGRTQFDIQEALRRVKASTSDLVGLKIAVMGCIVNGPGEMADADYGYVGAGPGKVHIYKGQDLVRRNIPQEEAVEVLLKIIHHP